MRRLVVLILMLPLLLAVVRSDAAVRPSCGIPAGKPRPGNGALRRVPAQYATIQRAVNASREGDSILIAPGRYREAVVVRTPGLRIRGERRSGVVLDGESRRTAAFHVRADRVVLENMTAHHYAGRFPSGVFWWEGVTGYWGRFLTAYSNANPGFAVTRARCGQIDNVYASGNSGSGALAPNACAPCDAVFTRVTAEYNAAAVHGHNASNLTIRDSLMRNNAFGIALLSEPFEDSVPGPARDVRILNNVVANNSRLDAPGTSGFEGAFCCHGILLAGTVGSVIRGNRVWGHTAFGIGITSFGPWIGRGNSVTDNVVSSPAQGVDLIEGITAGPDNCWAGNAYRTAAPLHLETLWACDLPTTPAGGDPRVEQTLAVTLPRVAGLPALNGRRPGWWASWPAPRCAQTPAACANLPDDNGNRRYADDRGVDAWLPALANAHR